MFLCDQVVGNKEEKSKTHYSCGSLKMFFVAIMLVTEFMMWKILFHPHAF